MTSAPLSRLGPLLLSVGNITHMVVVKSTLWSFALLRRGGRRVEVEGTGNWLSVLISSKVPVRKVGLWK